MTPPGRQWPWQPGAAPGSGRRPPVAPAPPAADAPAPPAVGAGRGGDDEVAPRPPDLRLLPAVGAVWAVLLLGLGTGPGGAVAASAAAAVVLVVALRRRGGAPALRTA